VYFIGPGDLSQSMGYTGQQTHPEVQQMMERGVKLITAAGRIARCSCPDNPTFWKRDVYAFRDAALGGESAIDP